MTEIVAIAVFSFNISLSLLDTNFSRIMPCFIYLFFRVVLFKVFKGPPYWSPSGPCKFIFPDTDVKNRLLYSVGEGEGGMI